jgi:hypothetical protein
MNKSQKQKEREAIKTETKKDRNGNVEQKIRYPNDHRRTTAIKQLRALEFFLLQIIPEKKIAN